jgi:uncharacterized protein involved in response to NO
MRSIRECDRTSNRPTVCDSAKARVAAVVWPAQGDVLLHVAACGWIAAFLGFAIAFGPLLLGSRWRALATVRAVAPAR